MPALPPIAPPLLAWYHRHRRVLPFREHPTPYGVWVSEIMLQQTRMTAVLPYYERFMRALPDIPALAAYPDEQLHKLWEGLGYYNRARNLRRAAEIVVRQHGGALPADYNALLALPGIGEYTAGAIASIAFGLPHAAVDGNVLRVFSRLLAYAEDVQKPAAKRLLGGHAARHQPPDAPGDYNQALMELGALVCLPGAPRCGECPLAGLCEANRQGSAASLPVRAPKKPKKERDFCVLLVHRAGETLLHRRPASGLLAGLWEPVLLEGTLGEAAAQAALGALLPGAALGAPLPAATHVFTHQIWRMYGWHAEAAPGAPAPGGEYRWATAAEINASYTLPGAFSAYRPLMSGGFPAGNAPG